MHLDHSFIVRADPDRTYAFLVDVNRVATCIPGMSSVEQQAPDRFIGVMRVKVGPIGVTYRGTATLTSTDSDARRATMTAEGTEGVGAGHVKAGAVMLVLPEGTDSLVTITTELEIAGRLAQFGRGIIDSVAKRIVAQMAECIRLHVEGGEPSGA